MMKALVYTGVAQLELRQVPLPQPGPDEVLIKVDSVGICGSDLHAYHGHDARRPAPLILGHEVAGVIQDGARAGQRVTVNPLVVCGQCEYCASERDNLCQSRQIISMPPRQGGFAQFLAIASANALPIEERLSLEKASLVEPIACGWHALRLAGQQLAYTAGRILIIGGGAIGIGAAISARAQYKCKVSIIETNPLRHPTIVAEGFELNPSDAQFDIVIDAVGYRATRKIACEKVKPGGVIAHIGLGDSKDGLDIRRITLQEISFIGTYTYSKGDFVATLEAMTSGALGELNWYECLPLNDGVQAFTAIAAGKVAAAKVILQP